MDITDIVAELGEHYINNGQGVKDIQHKFRQRKELDMLVTDSLPTTDTIARKATVSTSSVLQAYQPAFTKKGTSTFKIEEIGMFKLKADVEEEVDSLEESWLGFLAGIDELDRAKWPFVRWWLENEIMPQMEEEYELEVAYHGKYVAPTAGVAGAAGAAMDGDKVIINRHIANGRISPFIMGNPPTTDAELFVKYMEDFANRMPKALIGKFEPIRLNTTLGKLFVDGMDSLYNKSYARVEDKLAIHNMPSLRIASYTNEEGVVIPGLRALDGSNKIYTTIKKNSALRIKNPANEKVFKIESYKRQFSAFTDFWKGRGFWVPEYVMTNNVDLVV